MIQSFNRKRDEQGWKKRKLASIMIEHTAKIAAKTGSKKNYGIYLSTISSLANILSVLANLEKELSVKVKIYDSNDEKTEEEVERNKDSD